MQRYAILFLLIVFAGVFTGENQVRADPILYFTQQPMNTIVNSYMAPVQVSIIDNITGNVYTGMSATIQIAIGINPGGGNIYGDLENNTVNGEATFYDLRIDTPGYDYRLRASSTTSSLLVTFSDSFNISPMAAVPEPATMLLLGSGLVGLAGLRRKFRK